MDEKDDAGKRRSRNIALAIALVGLVILFFVMSVVQWSVHSGH